MKCQDLSPGCNIYYPSHYSAKQWLFSPEFPFNIGKAHHPESVSVHTHEFFVTLNRSFEEWEKEKKLGHISEPRKNAIWQAIKYIETNYKENIKLDEIAQRAHLTPNYFCEVFKKMTGKTVVEYRNEMRIKESCLLLNLPSSNITSVSLDVGFNDLTYFERVFKRYTGLSPRGYRAQLS